MCDYTSLSDTALIELCEELNNGPDAARLPDTHLSQVQIELSRRASELCAALDGNTSVCCRLDNWSLRVSPDPRHAGAAVLAGCAYGHRDYPDGTPIVSSPLQMIVRTADEDLAITLNSIYRLSAVHPDYISGLVDENL
jgi:hypothetical protein